MSYVAVHRFSLTSTFVAIHQWSRLTYLLKFLQIIVEYLLRGGLGVAQLTRWSRCIRQKLIYFAYVDEKDAV